MIGAKLDGLKPREKAGLAIALGVVFLVVVDRVLVSPLLKRCDEIQLAVKEAEAVLTHQRNVLAEASQVEAAYHLVEDMIGGAGSEAETIDAMKGEIDDMARAAGLSIVAMQHREAEKRTYIQEFIVDIGKYEGQMPALLGFLHELWHAPGLMRVRSMSATLSRDGAQVEGSIQITKAGMVEL